MAVRQNKTVTIKKASLPNITCMICSKIKKPVEFYTSKSVFHIGTGKVPYCKVCLKDMSTDEKGNIDMDKFKKVLEEVDKPFLYDVITSSYKQSDGSANGTDVIGIYFKNICSLPQYKTLTWGDSVFLDQYSKQEPDTGAKHNTQDNDKFDLEMLQDKYGFGYPDEEYYLFERKYQQLKPSVKVLTTLHDEFFREYCVNRVKETLAKSTGNFKEAKEWASMAKDAATAGKLNPSQMSKSDLSGGMDTFGQMARMVEETPKGELQNILPRFTERPKDKPDVVLWCNINYVRDLKGLPACDYKEIYKFYEERREQYESGMVDNDLNEADDNDG